MKLTVPAARGPCITVVSATNSGTTCTAAVAALQCFRGTRIQRLQLALRHGSADVCRRSAGAEAVAGLVATRGLRTADVQALRVAGGVHDVLVYGRQGDVDHGRVPGPVARTHARSESMNSARAAR